MAQIKALKFNDNVVAKTENGYLFDGKIVGTGGVDITGDFHFSSTGERRETITTGSGGIEIKQDGGDIVFIGENVAPTVRFYDTGLDLVSTGPQDSCGVLVNLLQYDGGDGSYYAGAGPFRLVVSQDLVTDGCGLSSGYVVFAVPVNQP